MLIDSAFKLAKGKDDGLGVAWTFAVSALGIIISIDYWYSNDYGCQKE
jgi:hypothetical protein